jgi:putative chitinase
MAYDPFLKKSEDEELAEELADNNLPSPGLQLNKFPSLNNILHQYPDDIKNYDDPIPTHPLPGEPEDEILIAQGPSSTLSKYSTRTTTSKYAPQERRAFQKLEQTLDKAPRLGESLVDKPKKSDPYANIKELRLEPSEDPARSPAEAYKSSIIRSMDSMGMRDPKERAAFMAQLSHESAGFNKLEEVGDQKLWNKYQKNKQLGNIKPGDGEKYKGRGFIQLTGRWNYEHYGKKLGLDLVNNPELAADPEVALKIAHLYWKDKNISQAARKGDFKAVTKKINDGLNGYDDRMARYKQFLSSAEVVSPELVAENDARLIFKKLKGLP